MHRTTICMMTKQSLSSHWVWDVLSLAFGSLSDESGAGPQAEGDLSPGEVPVVNVPSGPIPPLVGVFADSGLRQNSEVRSSRPR